MSKFARNASPPVNHPVQTIGVTGLTHEGGTGYGRDPRSELFLLAVTNMVSEATFYEDGKGRDQRYVELIGRVTRDDPSWVASFVPYLRDRLHMRSASLVMAAEYVRAKGANGRAVVSSALRRADEPAEMIGYWLTAYGRHLPQPVKRGVADAVIRLYDERAALRYDSQDAKVRMGDVIDLTHPTPSTPAQGSLFRHLLDKRHGHATEGPPTELTVMAHAWGLEQMPVEDRHAVLDTPERLAEAGFSWERLAGWLKTPMDAKAWEACIPSMGYMALLRNLRNFTDAKVTPAVIDTVATRLSDPIEVSRSRQLPFRFYSAWKAIDSMTFGQAIESALDESLSNVPMLTGRTLVLIDVSGSMADSLSGRSKAQRWESAALFGTALARRAEKADVFVYSNTPTRIAVREQTSLLRAVDAIRPFVGGGTQTWDCVRSTFDGQDRVVILTDEQAFASSSSDRDIPEAVPIYTFDLAGYERGHAPAGSAGRYTFGGLTDAGFEVIPLLERHRSGDWSFLAA